MPRFKLVIEYAGTRYSGWQIQKNARTVQGEIDRAIREVAGRREFELYGSGRTDAGVHALAQVAHLELYTGLAPEPLQAPPQRRAAGGHPHPDDRQGAAPLPRAPRRRVAQLSLSDLAPPDRIREAVRLVDPRAARSRRDATRGRGVRRPPGLRGLLRRRPRREINRRRPRAPRTGRGRRARARARAGLALSLEDGAPNRRRAGRGRARRDEAGEDAAQYAQSCAMGPHRRRYSRSAHRTSRWTVSGEGAATRATLGPARYDR